MKKIKLVNSPEVSPAHNPTDRREGDARTLLQPTERVVPECTSEVNLLKCIEILEKQGRVAAAGEGSDTLSVISDTLDRLAALR